MMKKKAVNYRVQEAGFRVQELRTAGNRKQETGNRYQLVGASSLLGGSFLFPVPCSLVVTEP
ncbi:MAG TPA: hypothetical protein VIQ60_02465 [Gemmatimonadaceae bacterium]